MKTTPSKSAQDLELDRLYDIAVGPGWIEKPKDFLHCAINDTDPAIYRKSGYQETALTTNDKEAVSMLYRVVAASRLSDIAKQRLCGACLEYFKVVCLMTPKEISEFKKNSPAFDPDAFNIFGGLGPNGK